MKTILLTDDDPISIEINNAILYECNKIKLKQKIVTEQLYNCFYSRYAFINYKDNSLYKNISKKRFFVLKRQLEDFEHLLFLIDMRYKKYLKKVKNYLA